MNRPAISDLILTGGQESDIGQAQALLELTPEGAKALEADKGYYDGPRNLDKSLD
jgi:hypothetical protein